MSQNGDGNDELKDYYVIKFEKYIELAEEIEHKYRIVADLLHDHILGTLPEFWDETPIPDIIEFFANLNDIRKFLDERINNTPEEVVKLGQKYNIKDVLLKGEELNRMNALLLAEEQLESDLEINHKICIIIN